MSVGGRDADRLAVTRHNANCTSAFEDASPDIWPSQCEMHVCCAMYMYYVQIVNWGRGAGCSDEVPDHCSLGLCKGKPARNMLDKLAAKAAKKK